MIRAKKKLFDEDESGIDLEWQLGEEELSLHDYDMF